MGEKTMCVRACGRRLPSQLFVTFPVAVRTLSSADISAVASALISWRVGLGALALTSCVWSLIVLYFNTGGLGFLPTVVRS